MTQNGMHHSAIPRGNITPNLGFLHQIIQEICTDSMQFLKTRSEVKFKVTVTQLWYTALCHPKMHPYTKFEIPTSNNMRYVPDTIILKTRLGQGHSDPKMVNNTPPSQDASTHQIWNSYLKEYKRHALDTLILKTRSRSQRPKNGM